MCVGSWCPASASESPATGNATDGGSLWAAADTRANVYVTMDGRPDPSKCKKLSTAITSQRMLPRASESDQSPANAVQEKSKRSCQVQKEYSRTAAGIPR